MKGNMMLENTSEESSALEILKQKQALTLQRLQAMEAELKKVLKEDSPIGDAYESVREAMHAANSTLSAVNIELVHQNQVMKEAREFAEAIVDTVHTPLLLLESDMRIETANKAFYRTFGLDPYIKPGVHLDTLSHPNWKMSSLIKALNEQFDPAGKFPNLELELPESFFKGRTFVLHARQLIQPAGGKIKILVCLEDITEQRRETDALSNVNGTFKIMAENAPVMIWMADTDKRRIYFNKVWLEFTGRSLQQEIGHGWEAGIHPDDISRSLNIYNTAFDKRKKFKKEYRLKRKDGKYRWVLSQGVPLFDNGAFTGYIGSCMDINYRVEQEAQKDEFVAMASHELKTPLTSIKLYTELLHETISSKDDKTAALLADKMDTQVDRLTWLVREMLDVSRITGGILQLEKESFDLNKVILQVVDDMRPIAQKHKFELDLRSTTPIWGDKERIRQVLDNLVSNAIKYSPDADRIIIKSETKGNLAEVSVKDFGIGISDAMKGRIFERFFRASNSENTFPGIGLGLYISAEIVKRHHGKYWFTSSVNGGSEFFFSLPTDQTRNGLVGNS